MRSLKLIYSKYTSILKDKVIWQLRYKFNLDPLSSTPLTVSHGVRVGQTETSQVDHAIGQVDVKTAHGRLQVAQLVQHHHAALYHRHHWSSARSRQRRSGEALSVERSIDAVLHWILLSEVSQEGQLLQTCDSLWKKDGVEQKWSQTPEESQQRSLSYRTFKSSNW